MKTLILITIFFIFNTLNLFSDDALEKLTNRIKILENSFEKIFLNQYQSDSTYENKIKLLIQDNKKIISKIKNITEDLHNQNNKITINTSYIYSHKDKLERLSNLIGDLEMDYQLIVKNISKIEDNQDKFNDDISYLELSYDITYNDLKKIESTLLQSNLRIDSIPDVFLCDNCQPIYSVSLGYLNFIHNSNLINKSNGFGLSISANFTKKISLIFEYQSPELNTKTYKSMAESEYYLDDWSFNIFSLGTKYLIKDYFNSQIKLNLKSNLVYGFGKRLITDFEENNNRNYNSFNSFGANLGLEISYNRFINKNPLELFLSIDNYILFKELKLNPGVGTELEMGNYLPSLNLGLRYNFW